jgi:quercetin dioxygenase-like cupin family protein
MAGLSFPFSFMKNLHRLLVVAFVLLGIVPPVSRAEGEDAYRKEIKTDVLLKTLKDAVGRKIVYPKTDDAELSAILVEIPAGAKTGWHKHTSPCVAYILEGELQVETEDGTKRMVKAGEAFAEVVNLVHNGQNLGSTPVKLILFVAGEKGAPVSVKSPTGLLAPSSD